MGKKRPKYMEGNSMFAASMRSIMQGLTWNAGKGAMKGGNFSQNGGEFLFVKTGETWDTSFVHRMRNTRDHSEVDALRRVLKMPSALVHDTTESKERQDTPVEGDETRQMSDDHSERPSPVKKRSSSLIRMARSWGRSRSNTNVSSSSGEAKESKGKGKEKVGYMKLDDGPGEVQAVA